MLRNADGSLVFDCPTAIVQPSDLSLSDTSVTHDLQWDVFSDPEAPWTHQIGITYIPYVG